MVLVPAASASRTRTAIATAAALIRADYERLGCTATRTVQDLISCYPFDKSISILILLIIDWLFFSYVTRCHLVIWQHAP
jgi:hypothetical protein